MPRIIVNGITCTTDEELEAAISELEEAQKVFIRNDFYGTDNHPPSQITPRQIRLALLYQGVTPDMIQSSLNSLEEPQRSFALVEWEYSTMFDRSHPLVPSVAYALGWTDEQLDQLWAFAATL